MTLYLVLMALYWVAMLLGRVDSFARGDGSSRLGAICFGALELIAAGASIGLLARHLTLI